MTLEEFFKYLSKLNTIEDRLVYMRYKYSCDDEWTYSNEILEADLSIEGCYIWLNDWNEGQENVEILGCIPISDINVPKFKKVNN